MSVDEQAKLRALQRRIFRINTTALSQSSILESCVDLYEALIDRVKTLDDIIDPEGNLPFSDDDSSDDSTSNSERETFYNERNS